MASGKIKLKAAINCPYEDIMDLSSMEHNNL